MAVVFAAAQPTAPATVPQLDSDARKSALILAGITLVEGAWCTVNVLMDPLRRSGHDVALQIACSAIAFGAVHGVWGFVRGSVAAGVGAAILKARNPRVHGLILCVSPPTQEIVPVFYFGGGEA